MNIMLRRFLSSSVRKPYSVLYFGSEEYACATLGGILGFHDFSALIKRLVVVAPPSTSTSSPTRSMHELIKEKKLEKVTFRKKVKDIEEYIKLQKECPFDLGIIGSFGRKVPGRMIEMFPAGMLVAHPSILPKYRGPCPIQHAVLNGEKETGVTIIEISKEVIDGGSVLWQGKCKIEESDDYYTLTGKCGALSSEGLNKILNNLEEFRRQGKKQEDAEATLAPMIKDSAFHWAELTPNQAVNFQRALYKSPSNPHSKIFLKNKWKYISFDKLKEVEKSSEFYKTVLAPAESKVKPGSLHWGTSKKDMNKLCIRCKDGWVYAEQIKMEGTDFVKAANFIKNQLGTKVFTHKLGIDDAHDALVQ
eukprot:TRINITY_DN12264_c0_g1_i10.p1 TRINITY_DN12264_c0_g1~~TRINITY_DN12264_c0_g1_i10.p1  ORF type:complete len:362 (-),score=95.75 TRINITY_DN12264_c0_g1_i10:545-1630(-)